jgi:hypothetical protein
MCPHQISLYTVLRENDSIRFGVALRRSDYSLIALNIRRRQVRHMFCSEAQLLGTNHFDSEIRQVPDNQEVYLDKDGFTSIVVDILERVEKPDIEALKFHLNDIVDEDAGETKVWTTGEAHFAKLP